MECQQDGIVLQSLPATCQQDGIVLETSSETCQQDGLVLETSSDTFEAPTDITEAAKLLSSLSANSVAASAATRVDDGGGGGATVAMDTETPAAREMERVQQGLIQALAESVNTLCNSKLSFLCYVHVTGRLVFDIDSNMVS